MPDSTSEQILKALFDVIEAGLPAGASCQRNAILPSRIPEAGQVTLRDGDPGRPEVMMSPLTYYYQHRAELDVIVDLPPATRDAAFDTLRQAIGSAIAADRTLGGLCDWVEPEAPAPIGIPIEGAEGWKAATIPVVLHYGAADPLL